MKFSLRGRHDHPPRPNPGEQGQPRERLQEEFIFVSESDIKDKIKARGWTGRTLVTTVTLHMDEGDIMNTLLFLSGTRQGDRIGAYLMFQLSG